MIDQSLTRSQVPTAAPERPAVDDPRRRRQLLICWSFVGVGVSVSGLYNLMPAGLAKDGIYQLIGLAGAAAIVIGVRLNRPARPIAWYLMAAGNLVWSLADAVFSLDATVLGNDRFPSPADALYLLAYPLVGVGLYLLIRSRRPRRDLPGFLDSAILTSTRCSTS
jgi:hypothetical protein